MARIQLPEQSLGSGREPDDLRTRLRTDHWLVRNHLRRLGCCGDCLLRLIYGNVRVVGVVAALNKSVQYT